MATFAHIAPGSSEVLDPRIAGSIEEYKASWGELAETTWADHTFKQVTDGTVHGAIDNGDGTFTNPVVVAPAPMPKALNKAEFQAHYAANGNSLQAALDNWPTA